MTFGTFAALMVNARCGVECPAKKEGLEANTDRQKLDHVQNAVNLVECAKTHFSERDV